MDAWYESIDRAYGAWEKAIAICKLEGSYRKLEIGNWQRLESLSKAEIG